MYSVPTFLCVIFVLLALTQTGRTQFKLDTISAAGVNDARATPCLLSCTGADGYGHQLEAKISCIAVAQHLHMQYVHTPFHTLGHGVDSKMAEQLLPIGDGHIQFNSTMQAVQRPVVKSGDCTSPSWFDDFTETCKRDGRTVYSADNCWEYYWCSLRRPEFRRTWFTHTLPLLQTAVNRSKVGTEVSLVAKGNATTVAVHIRRGDAGARGVPTLWFWQSLSAVLSHLKQKGRARVKVWVHSDDPHMYKSFLQSPARAVVDDSVEMGMHVPGNASLELLATHMLAADVLILSCSSLSHAFGMLANKTTIYPGRSAFMRAQARWLGWHLISVDNPEPDVAHMLGSGL